MRAQQSLEAATEAAWAVAWAAAVMAVVGLRAGSAMAAAAELVAGWAEKVEMGAEVGTLGE